MCASGTQGEELLCSGQTENDPLYHLTDDRGIDLLLLREQYQNRKFSTRFSDSLGTIAIWTSGLCRVPVDLVMVFVWIKSGGLNFFLLPFHPNEGYFIANLKGLEYKVFSTAWSIVVRRDFNAKAVELSI